MFGGEEGDLKVHSPGKKQSVLKWTLNKDGCQNKYLHLLLAEHLFSRDSPAPHSLALDQDLVPSAKEPGLDQ